MPTTDPNAPTPNSRRSERPEERAPDSRAPASLRPPTSGKPRPSDPPLSPEQRIERFDEMRLAPVFFFMLVALVIAGLVYILRMFIPDMVIAFVLVTLFRPTWRWISDRLGGRPWIASGIVTLLIVLVLAAPLAVLATTVASEAFALYESLLGGSARGLTQAVFGPEGWLRQLNRWLARFGVSLSEPAVRDLVNQWSQRLLSTVFDQTTAIVGRTLSILFHALVVLLAVFYLLVDVDRLKEFAFSLSPLPEEEDQLLVTKFQEVSRGILVGNGVGSLVQGVLGGLAMWFVGIPSAALWGTIMSVMAFLPIVGISLVVIPATVFLVVKGQVAAAVGFFTFCTVQGLIMENLGKTWLIGRSTRMHDLVVFLSVIGGIAAFGIMGLLYGPLLVAAFQTLTELYNRVYHGKLASAYALRKR